MHGTDPNVELIPADFETPVAECFNLYFTGVKGCKDLCRNFLKPKNINDQKPAILNFHGYSGIVGTGKIILGMPFGFCCCSDGLPWSGRIV